MSASPPPTLEQLLHWLAEAAELEHNLLCSYLFALFSLKQDLSEDLTDAELQAVTRWRKTLLSVCIEEMVHLAQVANITVALGARPHFNRPNLPVAAGYHPGGLVIELTRFDRDTLDHMIHLERPDDADEPDGASFRGPGTTPPREQRLTLMPSGPQYDTIGEFYAILKAGLAAYSRAQGAQAFQGPPELQLRPEEVGNGTLFVIRDLAGAHAAIDEIVRQGEGGVRQTEKSHYSLFLSMRDEFAALQAARPNFDPARAVARNPVMRAPVADDRCQVVADDALAVLDFGNSLYALMLRCLQQLYETRWAAPAARRAICACTFSCMKAFSLAACELTRFEAGPDKSVRAGVSFTMLRHTEGATSARDAAAALKRRGREILRAIDTLPLDTLARAQLASSVRALNAQIDAFALAV